MTDTLAALKALVTIRVRHHGGVLHSENACRCSECMLYRRLVAVAEGLERERERDNDNHAVMRDRLVERLDDCKAKLAAAEDRRGRLGKALAMAISAIKSGEPWHGNGCADCEFIRAALAQDDAPQGGVE